MIINFDFSQIEIYILGHLSKDKSLIYLLNTGVDLYQFFAAIMYDKEEIDVTKDERNSLKAPVLSISYGKGVKSMAADTGKSLEWCQQFIDMFYDMFPKVKELHDNWQEEVEKTGQIKLFDGVNLQYNKYIWNNKTKEKELFNPNNPAHRNLTPRYWTPQIKNYPVQHVAFNVIALFLSAFLREKAFKSRDKYLLINTIHDSIMLDCKPEYKEDAIKDIQDILDNIHKLWYNTYNEELRVPIRGEISIGDSWGELNAIH